MYAFVNKSIPVSMQQVWEGLRGINEHDICTNYGGLFLRKLTENVSLIKSFPKATQEMQETCGRTRSNQLVGRDATATPTWIRPFIISNDVTLKRDVHDHLLKPSQTF